VTKGGLGCQTAPSEAAFPFLRYHVHHNKI
jgi:hypothetical protein